MDQPKRHSGEYVPERFWEERYRSVDLTRSGHCDLPEAYNRWLYRRKQAVLLKGLQQVGCAPPGQRVLELGVGTGVYVDFWKRHGVTDLTGVDISEPALQALRARHPGGRFLRRDLTAPGLADEVGDGYSMVTALDVLYHVVDDTLLDAALRNVGQVLRPGGLLVMHDQFLHRPSEDRGYIRWRSLEDWNRLLGAAGFEVLVRRPIFFTMIEPTDVQSPRGLRWMSAFWDAAYPCIGRFPVAMGTLLYAADTVLGAMLKEGPSMELLIARRR
jgi:SAM-dependent methyltransferase